MPLRCLLIACLLTSCSCGKEASPPPPGPAPDTAKAPTAPEAAVVAPKEAVPAEPQKPAELPPSVTKEEFEALLPAAVGDWKRIELRSVVQPMLYGDILQSDGVYQLGNKQPYIFISITDTRGVEPLHNGFHETHDHPNVGLTPFEVGGQPAVEQFWPRPLNTVMMVLVDERFLILVNGEGSTPEVVKPFIDALDLKAFSALNTKKP